MDFTKSDASFNPTSPVSKASPATGRNKFSTITVRTLIVDAGNEKYVRVAFIVLNSYPIKSYLTFGAKFPNNSYLDADTKILYPDKVVTAARSTNFSEEMLRAHPIDALMKTSSWMPSAVITLVADKDPIKIRTAFTLVQSLNDQLVTNDVGDSMTIRVKVEQHQVVSPAEVPILKMYLIQMFDSRKVEVKREPCTPPKAKKFVLLGEEEENDDEIKEKTSAILSDDHDEFLLTQGTLSVGKRNGKSIMLNEFEYDDFSSSSSSSTSDPKMKKGKK